MRRNSLVAGVLFLVAPVVAQETNAPRRPENVVYAERQLAIESGAGTATMRRAPDGKLYVLNSTDRCIWIFGDPGEPPRRLFGRDRDGGALQGPTDFTFDAAGNLLIADRDWILVYRRDGELVRKMQASGLQSIHSLNVLTSGRILASGYPYDHLIYVYEPDGKLAATIGQPLALDADDSLNRNLNTGVLLVDARDTIYYVFLRALRPTIHIYSPEGRLLDQWNPTHPLLDHFVARAVARFQQERQESSRPRVIPAIFTGAGYDARWGVLWVGGAGGQLFALDRTGSILRQFTPMFDRRGFSTRQVLVEGESYLLSSYQYGVFEFKLPH